MGKLREIVESVNKSTQLADGVRENMNILMSLADSKLKLFQDDVTNRLKSGKTTDNLEVPITKIIGSYAEIRAKTKNTTTDLLQEVGKIINSMVSDHSAQGIISGLTNLAGGLLQTVMGTAMGTEQEAMLYTVTPDYPAIVRYDIAFWARQIEASSIRNYCETAVTCVMYKSSVDVTKLTFNDFLAIYSSVLNAAFGSDPSKLKAMVKEAKKVYDQFRQDSHPGGGNWDPEPLDLDSAMKIVASHVKPQGIILSAPKKPTVGNF